MLSKLELNEKFRNVKNTNEVTQLLENGMPIDFQDNSGKTLLMKMVYYSNLYNNSGIKYAEIIAQLISLGANLNLRDKESNSALKLAFENGLLVTSLHLIESREKVKAQKVIELDALNEIEEELKPRLMDYYSSDNAKIILMLLNNGAFFDYLDGVSYYETFLQLNQSNCYVYSVLHAIHSRYHYTNLAIHLQNMDIVSDFQRKPLYGALQETNLFPDVICQLISQYCVHITDEANELSKEDVERMYCIVEEKQASKAGALNESAGLQTLPKESFASTLLHIGLFGISLSSTLTYDDVGNTKNRRFCTIL
ncbi:MAG: hypothetical protein H0U75_07355 [Legionella sp.]|nr:hypothetical protein [Legionella sp.]